MLEARVLLMPTDNVSRKLLIAAQRECCSLPSWAKQVQSVRKRIGGLPDILGWNGCHASTGMALDKDERKSMLQSYRHQVVLPALAEYDRFALDSCPALKDWPFTDFIDASSQFPPELLSACWDEHHWQSYKA